MKRVDEIEKAVEDTSPSVGTNADARLHARLQPSTSRTREIDSARGISKYEL